MSGRLLPWWVACLPGWQIGGRAWPSPMVEKECLLPPGVCSPWPFTLLFPDGSGHLEDHPWALGTRCRELGLLFPLLPAAAVEGCLPGLVPRDVPSCSTPGRAACFCFTSWRSLVGSQGWGQSPQFQVPDTWGKMKS